jgi:UDP-N-acetylglucosamine 2-epimerase
MYNENYNRHSQKDISDVSFTTTRDKVKAQQQERLNKVDIKNTLAGEVMNYVLIQLNDIPAGTLTSADSHLADDEFWCMTNHEYQEGTYEQYLSHLVALNLLPLEHVGYLNTDFEVYKVINRN